MILCKWPKLHFSVRFFIQPGCAYDEYLKRSVKCTTNKGKCYSFSKKKEQFLFSFCVPLKVIYVIKPRADERLKIKCGGC